MAQHDYNIDNAAGAVVRADLNNLFDAVASLNSGATVPAATFANMWWFDTSTNLLKQRDNANTEWIVIGKKDANGWTPYRQGVALGDAATLTKDTDGTMAANADDRVATQKATKTLSSTKISKTIAGEIAAMTEKETLAADDLFLIEDSAGNNAKKKVKASNIRGGANYQVFTSNGTWVKPSSGNMVIIEAWGGGGGGGNLYGSGSRSGAGGGGGGAYARRIIPLSAIPGNVTVVVGAGGVGGVPAGNVEHGSSGNNGASSMFGTYLTAFGGGGGNAVLGNRSGGGGGGAGSSGLRTGASGGGGGYDGGGAGGRTASEDSGTSGGDGTGFGGGGGGGIVHKEYEDVSKNGGRSIFGGGGGASANNISTSGAGGVSLYGGNGARNNTAAGIPGGGGCGMTNSGNGNGARGEVRVWVV